MKLVKAIYVLALLSFPIVISSQVRAMEQDIDDRAEVVTLQFTGEGKRGSEEIAQRVRNLPTSLKKLDLKFVSLENPDRTNPYLAHLNAFPHLTELSLGNSDGSPEDIIDADLAHVVKCHHLKVLHLTSLDKVTTGGLCLLNALTNLERLELWWVPNITVDDVAQLLPRLQEWHIDGTIYLRHEQQTPKKTTSESE